jgi:hypothetical protein
MIMDARAQVDLIAALHLEALFKMGHFDNPITTIAHPTEYDALQLRHRLAVIQTLAVRARGLTVKTDMGTHQRRNDTVSSQSPPKRSS